jgi:hypothetical protein
MPIDHITPETVVPASWPNSYSYDPRQYLPAHCLSYLAALQGHGKPPRRSARSFIAKLRGIADGLDPLKPTAAPPPERPHDMRIHGSEAIAAEMTRLRQMAGYLEGRIAEFPDV